MLPVQSSGKLEMERGMVKPMVRGEQQDGRYAPSAASSCPWALSPQAPPLLTASLSFIRSQDGADKAELTLPASIEFRDNCEYLSAQC